MERGETPVNKLFLVSVSRKETHPDKNSEHLNHTHELIVDSEAWEHVVCDLSLLTKMVRVLEIACPNLCIKWVFFDYPSVTNASNY